MTSVHKCSRKTCGRSRTSNQIGRGEICCILRCRLVEAWLIRGNECFRNAENNRVMRLLEELAMQRVGLKRSYGIWVGRWMAGWVLPGPVRAGSVRTCYPDGQVMQGKMVCCAIWLGWPARLGLAPPHPSPQIKCGATNRNVTNCEAEYTNLTSVHALF